MVYEVTSVGNTLTLTFIEIIIDQGKRFPVNFLEDWQQKRIVL